MPSQKNYHFLHIIVQVLNALILCKLQHRIYSNKWITERSFYILLFVASSFATRVTLVSAHHSQGSLRGSRDPKVIDNFRKIGVGNLQTQSWFKYGKLTTCKTHIIITKNHLLNSQLSMRVSFLSSQRNLPINSFSLDHPWQSQSPSDYRGISEFGEVHLDSWLYMSLAHAILMVFFCHFQD